MNVYMTEFFGVQKCRKIDVKLSIRWIKKYIRAYMILNFIYHLDKKVHQDFLLLYLPLLEVWESVIHWPNIMKESNLLLVIRLLTMKCSKWRPHQASSARKRIQLTFRLSFKIALITFFWLMIIYLLDFCT